MWNGDISERSQELEHLPRYPYPAGSEVAEEPSPNDLGPEIRFTHYLRAIGDGETYPETELFDGLLASLCRALVSELRQRALWNLPPQYLGVVGSCWSDEDTLQDLLLQCYEYVFIDRLPCLKKQLAVRDNIDGLIFRSIRNFLHDTQKHHDPLGARIFQITRSAIQHLLDQHRLHRLDGPSRLANRTVLSFTRWRSSDDLVPPRLLDQVIAWNTDLLPELITAHHLEDVIQRLAEHIATLPEEGVEIFRFVDLVEPLKADARQRWAALAPTVDDEASSAVVHALAPGQEFEHRKDFLQLLRCTSSILERLEKTEKTKEYLRRLWSYLHQWSTEKEGQETTPSDSQLGEMLDIPRKRLPELRSALGDVVKACQHHTQSGEFRVRKTREERREALRQDTATAAARWKLLPPLDRPPELGDTLVLPKPLDLPVEWLVVDRRENRLQVVPIDNHPGLGSDDLDLDEVRFIRGGAARWLPTESFAKGTPTGQVGSDVVEKLSSLGTSESSTWDQQVEDNDPDYRFWMGALNDEQTDPSSVSTIESSATLTHVTPFRPKQKLPESTSRSQWGREWMALAAALVAVLGFTFLRPAPSETPTPFVQRSGDTSAVRFGEVTRGSVHGVEVVEGEETVVYLELLRAKHYPHYRVEVIQPNGETTWTSEPIEADLELILVLPVGSLEPGAYGVRLFGIEPGGEEHLIDVPGGGF